MGSSKKKSSFRIDDILQQQSENMQHHQIKSGIDSHFKGYSGHLSSALSAAAAAAAASNASTITSTSSHNFTASPQSSISSQHHHQVQRQPHSTSSSPSSAATDVPRKPMPMYPQSMLDMQKQNFCFPLPMGMPPFSHAAAYLEHYANSFHKGKT